jgi:peptidoglycan/LPS O-acetylase OafA/YrhL
MSRHSAGPHGWRKGVIERTRFGRGRIAQAGELRSSRIESLRAIAALGVMQGHIYGTAHGYGPLTSSTFARRILFGGGYGVFVFFALSGYLLYWPFARRDYGGGASINLRQYAINRALRILPLYYAVIVILLLVQEHGGSLTQWASFTTWTETFSQRTFGTVDGVVWSLIVELHFYILLPFLALALNRIAAGRRSLAAIGLLALGIASWGLWMVVTKWTHASLLWRYSLPATFYFFVPGMLVALIRVSWRERVPGWLRGAAASADAWVLASAALWLVVFWQYDLTLAVALASFLLVGACVLPLRSGRIVRALEWRPLAMLGVASYSLYLWHMPLIRLIAGQTSLPTYGYAGLVIRVAPVACLVAVASYAVIESPFLRLRRRWSSATPLQTLGAPGPIDSPTAAGGTLGAE